MSPLHEGLIKELQVTEEFFLRTIEPLTDADAEYRPHGDAFTVMAMLHHVAHSVIWFVDGAFRRSDGFAMNFDEMDATSREQHDFSAAKQAVSDAFADARAVIGDQTEEELYAPLPEGPIMGGAPRLAIVSGIVDHTAHHRGALSVYIRLLGKVPPMPYGDA
jgi:uncharacterized damage-inducible protein DinB